MLTVFETLSEKFETLGNNIKLKDIVKDFKEYVERFNYNIVNEGYLLDIDSFSPVLLDIYTQIVNDTGINPPAVDRKSLEFKI